jgi:hypothetical protein
MGQRQNVTKKRSGNVNVRRKNMNRLKDRPPCLEVEYGGEVWTYKLIKQDVEFEQDIDDDYNTTWYISADVYYNRDLDRHKAKVVHIGTMNDSVDLDYITPTEMKGLEDEALLYYYEETGDLLMEEKYRRMLGYE